MGDAAVEVTEAERRFALSIADVQRQPTTYEEAQQYGYPVAEWPAVSRLLNLQEWAHRSDDWGIVGGLRPSAAKKQAVADLMVAILRDLGYEQSLAEAAAAVLGEDDHRPAVYAQRIDDLAPDDDPLKADHAHALLTMSAEEEALGSMPDADALDADEAPHADEPEAIGRAAAADNFVLGLFDDPESEVGRSCSTRLMAAEWLAGRSLLRFLNRGARPTAALQEAFPGLPIPSTSQARAFLNREVDGYLPLEDRDPQRFMAGLYEHVPGSLGLVTCLVEAYDDAVRAYRPAGTRVDAGGSLARHRRRIANLYRRTHDAGVVARAFGVRYAAMLAYLTEAGMVPQPVAEAG